MTKRDFRGFPPPPPLRPPMVVLDRFARSVEEGHLVLYHPAFDLVFEVVAVRPVLNPGVQGGQAMQITLQAQFNVQTFAGVSEQSLFIAGESQARVQARAAGNGKPDQPSSQADGHVDPPSGPSGLVLTDALDVPPSPDPPMLECPACGHEATSEAIGTICENCGDSKYVAK